MPGGSATGRAGSRKAAWVLAVAILVATLANGAYGYLARLGLLDRAQYQEIVDTYCFGPPEVTGPLALSCRCMRIDPNVNYSTAPSPVYLYHSHGWRVTLKLAKEAVFLGLLAWSIYTLRRWRPAGAIGTAWPVVLLLCLLVLGFLRTLLSGNALFAVMGSRPYEFAAIAVTAAWMAPYLGRVLRVLVWLLLIEAALVVVEMFFGLPIRTCPNSFRAAGTMVLPNSLGVVAAMLMAFVAAFRPRLARNGWCWGAAVWLVIASGSGAGLVLLFLLACWLVMQKLARTRRVAAGAAAVVLAAGLLLALPTLTQRPQIFDSIFAAGGRVDKVQTVLREADVSTIIFGRGIGPGSNAAANLKSAPARDVREAFRSVDFFFADSTVTMLLLPFGVLGVAAWFLVLGWGYVRDRRARPFYLLAAVASLVINLPELFPVNLLLGLVLAHTLVRTGALRRQSA